MLISLLENLIYNNWCKICGNAFFFKNQNIFCKDCLNQIKKEKILYCPSCGKKTFNCMDCRKNRKFTQVEIFTTYSFIFQEVIKFYKFKNFKNLSTEIAQLISDDLSTFIEKNNINFILYIPSPPSKEKERGFNHLKEILIKCVPKWIIRDDLAKVKNTPLQVDLSQEERRENIKNSFKLLNKEIYTDKNVLIFDDILTTGSTIHEAYREVKKAKPKNIYAYIIAT